MDQISQMLVNGQRDLSWFEENINDLRMKYNNEFIAFHSKKILEHDSNLNNLIEKLTKKNINLSDVFIKFVSKVKAIL